MALPFPYFKVVFLIELTTLHSLSCEQINQSLDMSDAYKTLHFLRATCVSHVLMKHSMSRIKTCFQGLLKNHWSSLWKIDFNSCLKWNKISGAGIEHSEYQRLKTRGTWGVKSSTLELEVLDRTHKCAWGGLLFGMLGKEGRGAFRFRPIHSPQQSLAEQ